MSKAEKYIELVSDENGHFCDQHALRAVEIAREEMIDKACKWLQCHYRVIDGEVEDYIWSLKQAMKDE